MQNSFALPAQILTALRFTQALTQSHPLKGLQVHTANSLTDEASIAETEATPYQTHKHMTITQHAIDKFKQVAPPPLCYRLLAATLNISETTARTYIEAGHIMLTTRAAVQLIQAQTGLTDKEMFKP